MQIWFWRFTLIIFKFIVDGQRQMTHVISCLFLSVAATILPKPWKKDVICCCVLGISSFQGLKTYTPRKDSTNIWKTHVLPYHLLLQVPSRPIPANKASSAQSLVPFTMSDSCTVDRGFDSKKCIQTNPELGELYFHQPKLNNYIFRVRSYDVVIMGPGGWDPIQTKQLGVSPAENGFQKHMYGTVR